MAEIKDSRVNLTPIKKTVTPATRSEAEKKLEEEYAKDSQIVKGVFTNNENPGMGLEFVYKKYKQDPLEKYTFEHNGVYSIPLGVARHINNNTYYNVHEHTKDENGRADTRISSKVRRFTFQSMDYLDNDDFENNNKIVTVNRMVAF